jgi:elongation factor Ts
MRTAARAASTHTSFADPADRIPHPVQEIVTMEITAALVKQLRDQTGAGMMECKAALTETKGSLDDATTLLRKRGLAQAAKKAGRSTSEGVIGHYIHMGGKIGVLVEVNCESDFVARTEDFQGLVKEIAMHVAAANPTYVRREEVPQDVLAREREIYREQVKDKPAQVVDKIVEGKLDSFYEQFCLLDQFSIRDSKTRIRDLVQAAIAKLGENISIARFVRMKVGETAA